MNTRSLVTTVLAISGLVSLVSGLLLWVHLSTGLMKPLHLHASLVMTVCVLWHAWQYRKSLLRSMGGPRAMTAAALTVVLLGLSLFLVEPDTRGRQGGKHRAETETTLEMPRG